MMRTTTKMSGPGSTIALVAVLATGSLAGAEMRDLRLELRGLRLPAGAQSAMVAGVVSPPPAAAVPVAATLTLGGTRVRLEGRAFRSGSFVARVRRVDLLAPGASAADGRLQLSGAGIDEEIVIDAESCALAPRGVKRTCSCRPCTRPPTGVDVPDGTYTMHGPSFTGAALAHLSTPDAGLRRLRLLGSVFDSAWLDVSPSFLLDGAAIVDGDVHVRTLGGATGRHLAGASHVEGVIEGAGGDDFGVSWTFVLERPDGGTPPALGGPWRVDLFELSRHHVGVVPLSLDVAPDGVAVPVATTLEGAPPPGDPYEVRGGDCLIAPAGELSCQLLVRTSTSASYVRLHGALDLDEATGAGDFIIGLPPDVTSQGRWTATRP